MKLKKLVLTNFFSFGKNQIIDLNEYGNLVLVKGEISKTENSNGSGKSSLFEAVYWCLTGKTVRGVRAGDVVRIGEKSVEVIVEFEHKKDLMVVQRRWSETKKELVLTINGKEELFHDVKQGTQRVFEALGITQEILSLIGFYGRKFNTFSDLSPKERAEVVDLLAQGQKWEIGRDRAAKKARELEHDYTAIADREKEVRNSLKDDLKPALTAAEDSLKSFDEEQKDEIFEAKTLLDSTVRQLEALLAKKTKQKDIESYVNTNQEKSTALKKETIEKENEYEKSVAKSRDTSDKEIEELEALISQCVSISNEIKVKKDRKEQEVRSVRAKKGKTVCGECNQKLPNPPDNEAIEKEAIVIDKLCDGYNAELSSTQKDIEELKMNISTIRTLQRTSDVNHSKAKSELGQKNREIIDDLLSELNEYKNTIDYEQSEINAKDEVAKRLKLKLQHLENSPEKARLETIILNKKENVANAEKNLKELKAKAEGIEDSRLLSKYWSQGFKDLRFAAFENTTKVLEDLLNSFCSQQGLDFDNIEVTSWKENSSGKTSAEVNIYVVRNGNRMGLDALSEGETQRVDLACFFTFSLLIEKSIGFPIDFNVLDEPLSGLDYEGRQLVFNIINDISKNRQVFTIDHDANFQDLFNDVITVSKDNGVSTICK